MSERRSYGLPPGLIPTLWVPGVPRPQGSKRAYQRPGQRFPSLVESSPHVATWRGDIRDAVARTYDGRALQGPVRVSCVFVFARPMSHHVGGDRDRPLRPSAPFYHTQDPDLDKLLRSLADALIGIAWTDDNRVVEYRPSTKIWDRESGLWFTFMEARREDDDG